MPIWSQQQNTGEPVRDSNHRELAKIGIRLQIKPANASVLMTGIK